VRDWRIYADFAQHLIGIARWLYAHDPLSLDLDDTVYALDSTTIEISASQCFLGRRSDIAVIYRCMAGTIEAGIFVLSRQALSKLVEILPQLVVGRPLARAQASPANPTAVLLRAWQVAAARVDDDPDVQAKAHL
jgi:hypothetical protein